MLLSEQFKKNQKLYRAILISILIAVPVLYSWSYIFRVHTIPNNDYWFIFFDSVLMKPTTAARLQALLTTRCNDHLIVIPNILFYVNYLLTHGNNIGLFVIDGLVMMGILTILLQWVRRSVDEKHYIVLMPLLAFILFAPITPNTWFRSMSGIVWFTANLMLIATIEMFFRFIKADKKTGRFIALCVFSLLCMITYSSVLGAFALILMMLLAYVLFLKKKEFLPYLVIYSVLTILAYGLWFWDYSNRPQISVNLAVNSGFDPLRTMHYILLYFGSIFTDDAGFSMACGAAGIAGYVSSSAFIAWHGIYKRNESMIDRMGLWFLLSSGALLFALMISQTRFFQIPPTISMFVSFSRYNHLTVLFWLCLIYMFFIMITAAQFTNNTLKHLTECLGAVTALFICVSMYLTGLDQYQTVMDRCRYADHAGLAIQLNIKDRKAYKAITIPGLDKPITAYAKKLRKYSHVPCDKILIPEYKFDSRLDISTIPSAPDNPSAGALDSGQRLNSISLKLSGTIDPAYASIKSKSIQYILIANEQGHIRGGGLVERLDRSRWYGYAKIPKKDSREETIRAYARLKNGDLSRFSGELKLKYMPQPLDKQKPQ